MTSLLSEAPFFTDFPEHTLARLEEKSVVRRLRKNTNLMISGDECHSAYLMIDGSANAYTDDMNGEEFIINTFRKGDCFGELGVLDGLPRTANVITMTDYECMVIPGAELKRVIESDPKVAFTVVKTLVGVIRGMTEDVSCLALMDVYGRLKRVLNAESNTDEGGALRTERMTHQELSKRIGASREMVSKILKDLKTGGYISVSEQRITIEKTLPDRW